MLVMQPDGSIELCTSSPATTVDLTLQRAFELSEYIGYDIANQVQAIVDAKLARLAERMAPAPNSVRWSAIAVAT